MVSDWPLSPYEALVFLVGAWLQGFFGFGFGMAVMAGLSLRNELVHAASVVNLAGLCLAGGLALRLRHRVLWPVARRMLLPLVVGVAVGVTSLTHLDPELGPRLLGIAIVGIALWNLSAPRLARSESAFADRVAAGLAGLLGGAFNTGGPPLVVQIYRRSETPEDLVATIQVLFVSISVVRLPLATAQGQVGMEALATAGLALPILAAGSWTGRLLARRVDAARFRRVCWVALGVLGLGLMLR